MFKDRLKKIRKEISKSKKGIRSFVFNSFVIAISLWVMFYFIIGVGSVESYDMTPAMNIGDWIIYSRINKTPISQDVIAFEKDGEVCVSRVMAVPGDTVEITEEGSVLVNGNIIIEERIYSLTYPYPEFVSYPITLGEDEYFVLGDNRKSGVDSRYYGTVKEDEILGTIIMVIRSNNF